MLTMISIEVPSYLVGRRPDMSKILTGLFREYVKVFTPSIKGIGSFLVHLPKTGE